MWLHLELYEGVNDTKIFQVVFVLRFILGDLLLIFTFNSR